VAVDWVGCSFGMRGGSADDGAIGVLSWGAGALSQLRRGAADLKSRSNSPPQRRKKKGLLELGDSCPFPQRSARLRSRTAAVGPSESARGEMPSASISDLDINNCNSRVRATVNLAEPASLWAIGKQVGIFCRKEEEEVVKEYECMDDRDEEVTRGLENGGRYVSL